MNRGEIIENLQQNVHIVAIMGDGVNDAPNRSALVHSSDWLHSGDTSNLNGKECAYLISLLPVATRPA